MAIYHLSVKVISRAHGSSALASAAYRCGGRLHDERLGRDHDFTNKDDVVHSQVMLPEGANEAWSDRERLWNDVEAFEKRKDAQLCREVEFAIPRELDQAEGIRLAQDFCEQEFVARGMVADLNIHWDEGPDGEYNPHAHVMLTMREVKDDGFGAKVRDWNATSMVEHWREAWALHVNERMAELDLDIQIDHRSFKTLGIELEPQHKIGAVSYDIDRESERYDDHRRIASENGARLIANPEIAIDAITREQSTFTIRDLGRFIDRHSYGKEQFDEIWHKVLASPELVELGEDDRGWDRYTSREMVETERRLYRASDALSHHSGHGVSDESRSSALDRAADRGIELSAEQVSAVEHLTQADDLGVIIGYAGAGKSTLLGVAREAWEESGYRVQGLALSGIAAENLEQGSGIESRTIASLEHSLSQGRDVLTSQDILVIDEAGMVGVRQMERLLSQAAEVQAKVVLVGDPQQLQAIEAGAAFRAIAERTAHIEVTEVRRQQEGWQRDATKDLAIGRVDQALQSYRDHDAIQAAPTRAQAREDLIDRWDKDRLQSPDSSRIILVHTNDERHALNDEARQCLKRAGELGEDVSLDLEVGRRDFAVGERVMILKNDRGLEIKNGMLGELTEVSQTRLSIHLDNGRDVSFDLKDFAHVDYGYAATIHKAQGVTVDNAHVLATPGLDRHSAYVALSRHRESVHLHYGRDDFAEDQNLTKTLSRDRAKDMVSDYAKALNQTLHSQPPESEIQPAGSLTPESDIKLPESLAQEQAAIFAGRRGIDHPKDIHDPGDDLDVENELEGEIELPASDGRGSWAVHASTNLRDNLRDDLRDARRDTQHDTSRDAERLVPRDNQRDNLHDMPRDARSDIARQIETAGPPSASQKDQGPHRGIFAGFTPSLEASVDTARAADTREPGHASQDQGLPSRQRDAAAPTNPADDRRARVVAAIEKHARAVEDINEMKDAKLPVLPDQQAELQSARKTLDGFNPHYASDLENAYRGARAMTQETAAGNPRRAIQVLQVEAEIRANPQLRADRFVQQWQRLSVRRQELLAKGDYSGRDKLTDSMGEMARGLERDPQVESILENRKRELGISMGSSSGISMSLLDEIGRGRQRGLSIGF
jgi:Ti-type conjugative transfer relaxase TraA